MKLNETQNTALRIIHMLMSINYVKHKIKARVTSSHRSLNADEIYSNELE